MSKIFISPSSQEANLYVTGGNEEVVMKLIADSLCAELTRHGVEWQRNNRTGIYADHVGQSNLYKPDIHLAVHSNAMGGTSSGKARGTEVFCYDPADLSSVGTQLAQKIYARLSALTPTADRGIKSGKDTMSEIRNTNAPAVLVEIAFHDNPEDAAWIMSHIQDISHTLLLSVLEQFNVPFKVKPMTSCDVLYARGVAFGVSGWNIKAKQYKALEAVLSAIANNWDELDKVPYVGTLMQRIGDKLGN